MTKLALLGISAGYGALRVLWDIDFLVDMGEIVSVLGPNGAGKTTLLRTIVGLATIYSGKVTLDDLDITRTLPHERVKLGLSLVPEGRLLFPHMSVYENLVVGGYVIGDEKKLRDRMDFVFNLFPILRQRLWQKAGTLSGGEQQMLAIARALMSNPKILLLDEPSQGLAPKVVFEIFSVLRKLKDEGLGIVLVEQYVKDSLEVSDRVYVLKGGKVVYEGLAEDLRTKEDLIRLYLA